MAKLSIDTYLGDDKLVDLINGSSGGGAGKKYNTVVIGTSTMGHSAADVDYLCGEDASENVTIITNAINSNPNSVIYFLSGEYKVNDNIEVGRDGNIIEAYIIGENKYTTKIICDSSFNANGLFFLSNNSYIENICIDMTSASYSDFISFVFIPSGSNLIDKMTINNCYFIGSSSIEQKIIFAASSSTVLNNIIFTNNTCEYTNNVGLIYCAMSPRQNSYNVICKNNVITISNGYFIMCDSRTPVKDYFIISNNDFTTNITIADFSDVYVMNNYVSGYILSYPDDISNTANSTFSNATVSGNYGPNQTNLVIEKEV